MYLFKAHPQTSQMSQISKTRLDNVIPPTNVTTFKTTPSLRTTNVTMCHHFFCLTLQLLICCSISSNISLCIWYVIPVISRNDRLSRSSTRVIIGNSYLLIGQQQTTPHCFYIDSQNQIIMYKLCTLICGCERGRIPCRLIQLFVFRGVKIICPVILINQLLFR